MSMKKIIIAIALLAACPAMSQAQGFFDKMKKFAGTSDTVGVWKGSVYTIQGDGSINFPDGSMQEGTIQFSITADSRDLRIVYFTPAAEMKPKRIESDDIQYFTVKGIRFYPVRTKEDDMNIGNKTIFMEMVNALPDDKFKMYRLRKLEKNPMQGSDQKPYDLKRGYYVMLPEFKNAHEIIDLAFTPFAKKMSEYLKDCPDLAKKITDKESGYKYNMFNGAANDEIFLRVMTEYNNCQKQ